MLGLIAFVVVVLLGFVSTNNAIQRTGMGQPPIGNGIMNSGACFTWKSLSEHAGSFEDFLPMLGPIAVGPLAPFPCVLTAVVGVVEFIDSACVNGFAFLCFSIPGHGGFEAIFASGGKAGLLVTLFVVAREWLWLASVNTIRVRTYLCLHGFILV